LVRVTTVDQLLDLLDGLYPAGTDRTSRAAAAFWDALLQQEGHPLSSNLPDASLVAWDVAGHFRGLANRTALDVGCGLGRNSQWLASRGFSVIGIDVAPYAIEEAARRSSGPATAFLQRDFVREKIDGGPFGVVYDSGCFHHLAPHRRISYMRSLDSCLAADGLFGICTFAAGQTGTDATDETLLAQGRLDGGVGYTVDELQQMFSWLETVEAGPMPAATEVAAPAFSQEFLNVALYRRRRVE